VLPERGYAVWVFCVGLSAAAEVDRRPRYRPAPRRDLNGGL